MARFMQSLGEENYKKLNIEAKKRDITTQELIRAIIVPEWLNKQEK